MVRCLLSVFVTVLSLCAARGECFYCDLRVLLRLDSAAGRGDIDAYYKLAAYLDSGRVIEEFLDEHALRTSMCDIAARLIEESSLFTESEFTFDDKRRQTQQLKRFLLKNRDRIHYSRLTGTYLITAEEERSTRYQLQRASPLDERNAAKFVEETRTYDTTREMDLCGEGCMPPQLSHGERIALEKELGALYGRKDPEVLRDIAGMVYKGRRRWYSGIKFGDQEYFMLATALTGMIVRVPGDNDKMVSDLSGYEHKGVQRYLLYWAKHYRDYEWDEQKGRFVNRAEKAAPYDEVYAWAAALDDDNDSVSTDAFYRIGMLTETEAKSYFLNEDEWPVPACYAVRNLNFRDVLQVTEFAGFLRSKHIGYREEAVLRKYVSALRPVMPLKQRHELENKIVATMTLGEVSTLEYFSFFYHGNAAFRKSVTTVLDKFYTRNWQTMIHDTGALTAYVWKCHFFSEYYLKLRGTDDSTLALLREVAQREKNKHVSYEADRIAELQKTTENPNVSAKKCAEKPGKMPRDFEQEIARLAARMKAARTHRARYDPEDSLNKLILCAAYEDIPGVIAGLRTMPDSLYDKKDFLVREFGIWIEGNGDSALAAFMINYKRMDEYKVYAWYLAAAGGDVMDSAGDLDFAKVYQLFKYNIKDEELAYPAIKLLELRFGTTLGFPDKSDYRPSSRDYVSSGCSTMKRARAWVRYLRKRKLLPGEDRETPSFNFPISWWRAWDAHVGGHYDDDE